MFRTFLIFICCLILNVSVWAQEGLDPHHPEEENLKTPADWNVRLDRPGNDVVIGENKDEADIWFVNMSPGWHITTGPAGIFWHPESKATGTYRASTKIHLFDPKGRNEAFGLFIGGKNLKQDNQSYSYFLLRNSGEYLIKKRIGDETEIVKGWSSAPTMKQYTETTESSVPNMLSIEVRKDQVDFFVNEEKVHSLPRDEVDTEGIVGLRINHMLNVHVEDLSVKKL